MNHIAIDCGCGLSNGRLAPICLETGEEILFVRLYSVGERLNYGKARNYKCKYKKDSNESPAEKAFPSQYVRPWSCWDFKNNYESVQIAIKGQPKRWIKTVEMGNEVLDRGSKTQEIMEEE